jgi:hypothetical protein
MKTLQSKKIVLAYLDEAMDKLEHCRKEFIQEQYTHEVRLIGGCIGDIMEVMEELAKEIEAEEKAKVKG